jgi:Tol biopolymer transport system component
MQPRIAYLYPADDAPQNIWIADISDTPNNRQITNSPSGIYDFAVSPDGSKIAFAENNTAGTIDIKLLDLDTGALIQLTNCADASCTTPVWRPDGRTIAYERIEYNSALDGRSGPPRIWLIDLTVTPATTRPLFSDLQILGYGAQWSADGSRIALMDRGTNAILIYDFADDSILAVPSPSGMTGVLSPDGTRLAYAEVAFVEGEMARSKLQLADLLTSEIRALSLPDDPVDDKRAQWHPSGEYLAVARDDPRVYASTQIYRVDPDDGSAELITDDPLYTNTFFWWNPSGTQLVIQRLRLLASGQTGPLARPEIWVYDVANQTGLMLADNGFLPRWIP